MSQSELSLPPDVDRLEIIYYPDNNEELRKRLWPLTLDYGTFRTVLSDPSIYQSLQALTAIGPRGGIHGWAGIYTMGGRTFIGIFVEVYYRHKGLGTRLLNEALKVCKERGITCTWQDRKDKDAWVEVKPDGTTTRSPYESLA